MNSQFSVFPVGPDKRPRIAGWQDKATNDPAVVAAWREQGATAFGIPTGARNQLFVVDLDVDKETGERVGERTLANSRYAALLEQIAVRTPSGGGHIYLQHFEGARNTTSKLGPKIDTRGEGGYVVAPGSVTERGKYLGHFPDKLPPVPMGLRAMFLQKPTALPKAFDRATSAGEVEELLQYIPADASYSDWVSVLMAIHDKYSGSDEGLMIADKWSAMGSKYKQGEVAAKWRTFKGAGISWATIPAMARQNGADLSEIARRWPS